MLKAAKNMRGKLALLYRVTGRPGHRLHIFLNSTYELKLILCIPFTMLKAAKNMRGKLALLYRVTGRPGHRLHIFLNSTSEQICAAAHICSDAHAGPFWEIFVKTVVDGCYNSFKYLLFLSYEWCIFIFLSVV